MALTDNKNRIDWIDMAKGYGMIAVIVGHIWTDPLKCWIYTFHMPLFFFLSGYVFSNKDNFDVFIKKKAKSLLIPYFSLGIPVVVFSFLLKLYQKNFTFDFAIDLIKNFILQKRLWTLWYIACLFFLNILFYIITKLVKNNILRGAIVISLACVGLFYYKIGGLPLPWNIDVCFTAIPFFFIGYIFKLNNEKIEGLISKKIVSVIIFAVLGVINIIFWYLNLKTVGHILEMYASKYANPVFTYISAFAGIFAVALFSRFFTLKPIKFIGQNSLVYYAWHHSIMIPLTTIVFSYLGFQEPYDILQPYYWCYKIVQFTVIVIILTIPTLIIEKTNLRVILGKEKRYKKN